VWTEIVSHLKGSVEALYSLDGKLTLEQYQDFGAKRSRLDKGDERERVFKLFETVYCPFLTREHHSGGTLFDLGDVCHHLWQRIQRADLNGMLPIHQVYIDEVQDLTQAEIAILFKFANPNAMFLAGDTAQVRESTFCCSYCFLLFFWSIDNFLFSLSPFPFPFLPRAVGQQGGLLSFLRDTWLILPNEGGDEKPHASHSNAHGEGVV